MELFVPKLRLLVGTSNSTGMGVSFANESDLSGVRVILSPPIGEGFCLP